MFTSALGRFSALIWIPFMVAALALIGCSPGVLQSGRDAGDGACPDDWEHYDGHCYRLTTNVGTWAEAEAEAVAAGGHLVTVNDENEQLWLNETFPFEQGSMWIGLYQPSGSAEPDSGWLWISEEPVTYTNWAAGEPDEAPPTETNEDRAAMHALAPGLWMDVPEDGPYLGIMEVDAAVSFPPPPPGDVEPFPPPPDPNDPNDIEDGDGDGGDGDADGTARTWFEGWQAAQPGVKGNLEFFDADRPVWLVSLGHDSDDCGAAEVWIDEGQSLCLRASAEAPDSTDIFRGEPLGPCPYAWGLASVRAIDGTFLDEEGHPMASLSRDTIFRGAFSADVYMGGDGDLEWHEHAYAGIALNYGNWLLRYVHENSRYEDESILVVSFTEERLIFVSDYFERNVFDDLVALYGQEFSTWYEQREAIGSYSPVIIDLRIITSAWAQGPPDGAIVAECTTCVDFLAFTER